MSSNKITISDYYYKKTEIDTMMNGKSNTNHTHTWTSQECTSYGTLYINSAIRICELKYYRKGYNFTNTSWVTLHSNAIPEKYRPKWNKYQIGSAAHILGGVDQDGTINCVSSKTGTQNINLSFVWHY